MDLTEHTLHGVATKSKQEIREWIQAMVQYIGSMPERLSEDSCPVKHVFAPGVYCREMHIPKGMLLVGQLHRQEHVNIVSQGRIVVLSDTGLQYLDAPCTFVSGIGTKRLGYALADTVWTTVHPTTKTDLAEIHAEVIAEDYSAIELEV